MTRLINLPKIEEISSIVARVDNGDAVIRTADGWEICKVSGRFVMDDQVMTYVANELRDIIVLAVKAGYNMRQEDTLRFLNKGVL